MTQAVQTNPLQPTTMILTKAFYCDIDESESLSSLREKLRLMRKAYVRQSRKVASIKALDFPGRIYTRETLEKFQVKDRMQVEIKLMEKYIKQQERHENPKFIIH